MVFCWVFEKDPDHESIQLAIRQWISSVFSEGILSGNDKERIFEGVRCAVHGDLFFLHAFQKRALCSGWRAVEFIGEENVCKDWTGNELKIGFMDSVYRRSCDIARHEVRGKLNARKFCLNGFCQGIGKRRFGKSRCSFDENVPICEKCDDDGAHVFGFSDILLGYFVNDVAA